MINEYLANNTEDGNLKDQYNTNVINYSDEYLTILDIRLAVYEEGQTVADITTNRTWNKRKDTVDKLAKGLYDVEEETEDASDSEGEQESEDGEMGE